MNKLILFAAGFLAFAVFGDGRATSDGLIFRVQGGSSEIAVAGRHRKQTTEPVDLLIPEFANGRQVTMILDDAFIGDDMIRSVTFGPAVWSVGRRAFKDCTRLQQIVLPDGLSVIGEQAFAGCSVLHEVELPNRLQSCGQDAFTGCNDLRKVVIGDSVTCDLVPAFYGCRVLQEFVVGTNNNAYAVIDGALCDPEGEVVYLYPRMSAASVFKIRSGVRKIASGAFYGCANLTRVEIPDSVEEIGENAFAGSGLAEVSFPAKIWSLQQGVLSGCTNLCVVNMPKEIGYISKGCFAGCTKLQRVNFFGDRPHVADAESELGSSLTITAPESAKGWDTKNVLWGRPVQLVR